MCDNRKGWATTKSVHVVNKKAVERKKHWGGAGRVGIAGLSLIHTDASCLGRKHDDGI